MISARTRSLCGALLGGLVPTLAAALPAIVDVPAIPCVPREENAVVYATVSPDTPQDQVRLFFRRDGYGDSYYMIMKKADDKGHFFGVLPKPDRQNLQLEYHVHVRGPNKETLAASPDQLAPVTGDCKVELTKEQKDMTNELVVGETRVDQKGHPVAWFLCNGIVSRIDVLDQPRPDEFCAVPPGPVPIVAYGAPTVGVPNEASPSRP
jgi:hypothetical protein